MISRLIVDLGPKAKTLNDYVLDCIRGLVSSGILDPIDLDLRAGYMVARKAAKMGLINNPDLYKGSLSLEDISALSNL